MAKGKNETSKISNAELGKLIQTLKARFISHSARHKDVVWSDVEARIVAQSEKASTLLSMESTGGEPDVVGFDQSTGEFIFFDCSPESPASRRSLCYDQQALNSRRENKPKSSAIESAAAMGIES